MEVGLKFFLLDNSLPQKAGYGKANKFHALRFCQSSMSAPYLCGDVASVCFQLEARFNAILLSFSVN
jgi:hypothetical protein